MAHHDRRNSAPEVENRNIWVATDVRVSPVGTTLYSSHPTLSDSYLQQFATQGMRLHLIARTTNSHQESFTKIETPIEFVPIYSEGPGAKLAQLLKALWQGARIDIKKDDIVIVRLPETLGIALGISASFRKANIISNVVAFPDALGANSGALGRLATPIVAKLAKMVVKHSDAVVYVTKWSLQKQFPASPTARTWIKSNVDLPDHLIVDKVRESFAHRPLRIVTVGTLNGNSKGIDTLLRAIAELNHRNVEVTLSIYGDGSSRNSLEQLASMLGVVEATEFHGHVGSKDLLAKALAQSDLFVLASRSEGLPRAMIEAQAAGLPAVGTAVGGIPELVPDWATSPPGDYRALAANISMLNHNREKLRTLTAVQHPRAKEVVLGARVPVFRNAISGLS